MFWEMTVVKIFVLVFVILLLTGLTVSTVTNNALTGDVSTQQSRPASATTFNTQTPISMPPDSAMAALNKIPGGIQSAILPLLISGGSLDMSSITQLMTVLGPQLFQGSLQTNISDMTTSQKMCYEDIETFLNDTTDGKMWAIAMLDASGKPGPALLKGATKFYGNFEQCLEAVSHVPMVTGRKVEGDTCVLSLSLPPQLLALKEDLPDSMTMALSFDWHLCLPNTCDDRSVRSGLQDSLSQMNLSISSVTCHSEAKIGPLGDDPAAIGAIILIAVLGFLVVLATVLDLCIRQQKKNTSCRHNAAKPHEIKIKPISHLISPAKSLVNENIKDNNLFGSSKTTSQFEIGVGGAVLVKFVEVNGVSPNNISKNDDSKLDIKTRDKITAIAPLWQRLLLCFSAVSNGEKILSVKTSPGSLTCLNGVRVLSMGWVILGHTFSTLIRIADNPSNAVDMTRNLFFQVIINGTLSVDSFFVLSGLLVTYLFLRETEKAGGVTVKHMVLYYVHRYWRLTPAYAFMIFLSTFLVRYLGDGPSWQGIYDEEFCKNNWWINLLYLNNLVRVRKQCFGVGWYLANDMQFYVIAPLALIPLALSTRRGNGVYLKVFGLCVIGGFLITSIVTTAYFVHETGSNIFNNSNDYMFKVYFKPWCRVGTFAVGMALGYILHTSKGKINVSTFLQGVCWFLALVAAGAATLSTYDEHGPGRSVWDVGSRTAHETLFRPVWGLVLSWVILMCCSGKAGIIYWMLSWAWWQPLARLTYGAFLIHPIMMQLDMGTATSLVQYTTGNLVNLFFGYTCLSYIFAFLLAILVEAPLLQLEKLVLGR